MYSVCGGEDHGGDNKEKASLCQTSDPRGMPAKLNRKITINNLSY